MKRYSTAVVLAVVFCSGPALARGRYRIPDPAKGYKWQDEAKKRLKPPEIELLGRDNLLIRDEAYRQIFTPYLSSDIPLFITSDSLLNAFHVLYEESVLRLENANARKLPGILQVIWKNLPSTTKDIKGKPKLVAAARRRAQVVIGTALKLLGDKSIKPDGDVVKLIDAEVARVVEAKATMKPKWLGPPDDTFLTLDYSRYKPRGFYTKSPGLQRYFRAVSWLQSIPFRVAKDEELLAILMLGNTVTFSRLRHNPTKGLAMEAFCRCYRSFVGAGDDWDILKAAHEAQNELAVDFTRDGLSRKRDSLIEKASGYGKGPKINDQIRFAPDDPTKTAEPNFRILSAYRTPDAILFHRTTDLRRFQRPFPDGLEVCALLGSTYARAKLTYKHKVKLLATIDGCKALVRGDTLYAQYLRCLAALLDKPEPDAPKFMSGVPWQIKSCQAALAGWAQLRHTWALQAKQTVHYMGLTMKPPGFVEPEPEFFARMADLVRRTETLLEGAGAFQPDTKGLVDDLRAAAGLIERKDFATKGRKAFEGLSSRELMRLNRAIAVLVAFGEKLPDGEKTFVAFSRRAPAQLRKAADRIEKGQLPDPHLLSKFLGAVSIEIAPLWRRLHDLCVKLEALAHKQLRGAKFSDADNAFILHYGEAIAAIMLYGGNSYLTPNDDAPRIIDVYTNPMLNQTLEVGVGRARALYVLYPLKGGEVLCRGAVMPYYEFRNAGRLTDEQWKQRLGAKDRPAIPAWIAPIVGGGKLVKPKLGND